MGSLADYGKSVIQSGINEVKNKLKKKILNPYVLAGIAIAALLMIVVFAIVGAAAGGSSEMESQYMSASTDYVVKTDLENTSPVITDIDTLKSAFSGYPTNSKLLAEAQTFLDMQEKYKVNAIFAAAIAIQETTAGTNGTFALDGHNWFNYVPISGIDQLEGYLGTQDRWCKWDTDAHGIMGLGYYISQHSSCYFSQGEYTVSAIGSHYCAPPDNWIKNVKLYMNRMYVAAGIGYNSDFCGGIEIYNQDGSVNEEKMEELDEYLTKKLLNTTHHYQNYANQQGPFAKWWTSNGLSNFQCTWWAYGRASQYLELTQSSVGIKYPRSTDGRYGNGGEFYERNQWFQSSTTEPRANSLVSWNNRGCGHVAYVEAMDPVTGDIWVSHAGGGNSWFGIQKLTKESGYIPWQNLGYTLNGFIYLDQPK